MAFIITTLVGVSVKWSYSVLILYWVLGKKGYQGYKNLSSIIYSKEVFSVIINVLIKLKL